MPSTNFVIQVISIVGPVDKSKGKSTWKSVEIAYRRDGKVEGKSLVDFNGKEVFETVTKSKQGEFYEVTSEKDANGYWQWTGFERTTEVQAAENQAASSGSQVPSERPNTTRATTGRVTGSNYETSEERERNRIRIGRQACLNSAIAAYSLEGFYNNKVVSDNDVISLAEKFEKWVQREATGVEAIKKMVDDIPF